MADKTAPQKEVESTAEEVDKAKATEEAAPAEDETKSENGDSVENGDANGTAAEEKTAEEADDTDNVCSIKRKSTSGDVASEAAEGATPEKKAKLQETTEAESNGEAEVAA